MKRPRAKRLAPFPAKRLGWELIEQLRQFKIQTSGDRPATKGGTRYYGRIHTVAQRLGAELYEGSGGTQGTTLRDTGLPVIIVTNRGNKTGAIRKTPLMRVKDGDNYVLVGSRGGAPTNPVWVYNLRADGYVKVTAETETYTMRAREVEDDGERARLWDLSVAAFPPYADYQNNTSRKIPVFVAEPA